MISRLFILYKMKLYLTDWGFWLLSAVKNDKLFLYFLYSLYLACVTLTVLTIPSFFFLSSYECSHVKSSFDCFISVYLFCFYVAEELLQQSIQH